MAEKGGNKNPNIVFEKNLYTKLNLIFLFFTFTIFTIIILYYGYIENILIWTIIVTLAVIIPGAIKFHRELVSNPISIEISKQHLFLKFRNSERYIQWNQISKIDDSFLNGWHMFLNNDEDLCFDLDKPIRQAIMDNYNRFQNLNKS